MPATLSVLDRTHLEMRLHERERVLRAEIRAALLRAGTERYADIADRLQDAQDHALSELLADVTHADVLRDATELRDIDGALRRIATGTYGECITCSAQIPRARINAYPTAKRCLPCQQLHERATDRSAVPGPAC
jgi:DnaK suppressor protein